MVDNLKTLYSAINEKDKAYTISRIALLLTVFARNTYRVDSMDVDEPKKLRLYNELYHTLHGQLCAILMKKKDCYPDDIFIDIICEKANNIGIFEQFYKAFSDLLNNIRSKSNADD